MTKQEHDKLILKAKKEKDKLKDKIVIAALQGMLSGKMFGTNSFLVSKAFAMADEVLKQRDEGRNDK